ncbi:hypothetical protein BDV28DRAFT_126074 [Aspergillus coremiiformis]|uniref:Uncharacterized protein n=1 Tax=Aspergillus coremiiformis TaxID=138285 RepID=A0A5N6ZLF3_9EURO|nr:hypothetical protein BDV28DRAFT_126074 [Aspergillus coremiiformis]
MKQPLYLVRIWRFPIFNGRTTARTHSQECSSDSSTWVLRQDRPPPNGMPNLVTLVTYVTFYGFCLSTLSASMIAV